MLPWWCLFGSRGNSANCLPSSNIQTPQSFINDSHQPVGHYGNKGLGCVHCWCAPTLQNNCLMVVMRYVSTRLLLLVHDIAMLDSCYSRAGFWIDWCWPLLSSGWSVKRINKMLHRYRWMFLNHSIAYICPDRYSANKTLKLNFLKLACVQSCLSISVSLRYIVDSKCCVTVWRSFNFSHDSLYSTF